MIYRGFRGSLDRPRKRRRVSQSFTEPAVESGAGIAFFDAMVFSIISVCAFTTFMSHFGQVIGGSGISQWQLGQ